MNTILAKTKALEERVKKLIPLHAELKHRLASLEIENQQLKLTINEQQNIISQFESSNNQTELKENIVAKEKIIAELALLVESVDECITQIENQ